MGTKYGWKAWLGRAEMKGKAKAIRAIFFGSMVVIVIWLVVDHYIF